MNRSMIENYVERVYAYSLNRTYSVEEAEELSQEILFTALRELPSLRDESRFEPWLWGLANNVTKTFRRRLGKQRAMFSYDVPVDIAFEKEDTSEDEELYASLRKRIAMLSSTYRDVIILYYYENLSVKEIASRLDLPEGTVTWRLSEARKKLKKECTEMKETALKPVRMNIGIYGSGNYDGRSRQFPDVYISDALSQNILYYCYEENQTVETLSELCGVPAYYIEERIANLIKRQAVTEPTKGKYRTDFIIQSDKHYIYFEENAERSLRPIMDKLLAALKAISAEAAEIDFYKAEKSENDLFYLYGALAFEYAMWNYCKLPYPRIKDNYDGFAWRYIGDMRTGNHNMLGVGISHSANLGTNGTYSHTVFKGIPDCNYREMMYDNYINVCEDILNNGFSEDVGSAACAIQAGYITRRDNGRLFVTVPAFTKCQKKQFGMIAEKYLSPLMDEYSSIVNSYISNYKKLFPKHLNDDVDRMCRNTFLGFYSVVIQYALNNGVVARPSENYVCEILTQFK